MSWGRTVLGDVEQPLDVEGCEQEIARLVDHVRCQSRVDSSQDTRMEMLEAENHELKLYLAAVIRLMMCKGVMTRSEFARLVDIVDRSDGVEDGQFRGDIAQQKTWTGKRKQRRPDADGQL